MSVYPIRTLEPGDCVRVGYLQSSGNVDSWRTDIVTVERVVGEFVLGTDGCRYHAATVSGLLDDAATAGVSR